MKDKQEVVLVPWRCPADLWSSPAPEGDPRYHCPLRPLVIGSGFPSRLGGGTGYHPEPGCLSHPGSWGVGDS